MSFRDRFDRNKRQPSTRTQRLGLAFFWLLVLSFSYFIALAPNFNTESHLYLACSIVDRHSLNIDQLQTSLGDKSWANGHWYSDKAPGLSFLEVPVYAGLRAVFPQKKCGPYIPHGKYVYQMYPDTAYLRYAISYIVLMMPSAILAILLWLFLAEISGKPAWSLFLAAAYALGTIAWEYSVVLFSHQICAILLFGAFLLLWKKVRDREPNLRVYGAAALGGLLSGYSIISEFPTALIVGLIGLYLLFIARAWLKTGLAFLLGMVPCAALDVWYNVTAFGKPFAMGYTYVKSQMYHSIAHPGFLGLSSLSSYGVKPPTLDSLFQITVGSYRGVFFLSPVLFMFFAGLYFMWKQRSWRRELWLCLGIVVLYFLMDAARGADQNGWTGGYAVGSRHLTPMLPFMFIPMAFGLASRWFRMLLAALAVESMTLMFFIVSSDAPFKLGDYNPVFNEVFHDWFRGKIGSNWIYLANRTGPLTVIPYFVISGLLVYRIAWLFRNMPAEQPALVEPEVATATATAS